MAKHIAGITDMASAGVALLRDIQLMFGASTLDHLTSKAIINNLTADPEKPWAEWSRGKPISEKGLAKLLHEYRICSRTVGLRGSEAKGYLKADFEDAWERYVTEKGAEAETKAPKTDILPSIRRSPSNDSAFAEKFAVVNDGVRREKNGHLSSEINDFDVTTGKTANLEPPLSPCSAPSDWDDLDIPDFLRREVPPDRRPALGPEGDSLEDFK